MNDSDLEALARETALSVLSGNQVPERYILAALKAVRSASIAEGVARERERCARALDSRANACSTNLIEHRDDSEAKRILQAIREELFSVAAAIRSAEGGRE